MTNRKDYPDALRGGEPEDQEGRLGESRPLSPQPEEDDPGRQESSLEPTEKAPRTPGGG